jgi:DeoR/GlpR family transcriptional regulator of sugar metabolism
VSERLYLRERRDQIVALLQRQGRVSVAELCRQFGVSAVTVRNDLAALEHRGLLLRTHGGAVVRPDAGSEPLGFALRKKVHPAEKERIGRAAAEMVGDGESIALDGTTTAWQIARNLKERQDLTVVTNGLLIALEFLESPGVTVVMPGGTLRAVSASLMGEQGACIMERYHVQKGFFGAGGFTVEEGLTDTSEYEVGLKKRMMERSKEVVAVVDSSKWGLVNLVPLVRVDELQHVISDKAAPAQMVAALRARGVRVTLV